MSCRNVFIILTTLLLSTVVLIHSAPVQSSSQAQMYLSKFGYLPETSSGNLQMIHENTMIQAIQNFQEFAGLDVTGQLDSKTLELMSLPRCGVKDKRANSRSKRSFGTPWRKKDLTYRISRYTRRMDRNNVDAEIARAFNVWSEHTDLSFTAKRSGPVDIDITFLEGEHGDGNPFDGAGGTLAHAYSPEHGDAHFDDAEHWSINSPRGTNLFQVAAHEFGHSLGLDHSAVQEALMAPYYRRYEPYFRLHSSDITEIQELYGRKSIQEDSNNGIFKTFKDFGQMDCEIGRSEEPTTHHHHHNDEEDSSNEPTTHYHHHHHNHTPNQEGELTSEMLKTLMDRLKEAANKSGFTIRINQKETNIPITTRQNDVSINGGHGYVVKINSRTSDTSGNNSGYNYRVRY